MQIDTIGKIYMIHSKSGKYVKITLYPSGELPKRMSIGSVSFDEPEARRLYAGLKAYFENSPLPEYVEVKDITNMEKAQAEFRVKQEKAMPTTAEQLQMENMRDEGRENKEV